MEVSHAKHKVYKIRYHMVICAKYRKMLLLEKERIAFLKELLQNITERYEIKFEAMGTTATIFIYL
jgi:REP element-mobilizing transposase RayT